jgi:RNA-directed DNA polymerase
MNMVRYADDFIITGHSKEWLEHEVRPAVVEFLAERGLVLSPEKTRITHIKDGFDFLGWNIRKYNGKLLMKPSKANVKAHLDKIREIIKANKTAKQASLIRLLNPVLRGWANYHSHVVAKKAFDRVDHEVWSMLWRWAVRRHPKKGARWLKYQILQDQRFPELGICRNRKKRGWHDKRGHLAQGIRYANKTAYQDQSGRQSARSAMGAVLRIPMG